MRTTSTPGHSTPMYLNTTNPKIKSLSDFGPGDKIAVAGVKSSLPAGILQMMAAHEIVVPAAGRNAIEVRDYS